MIEPSTFWARFPQSACGLPSNRWCYGSYVPSSRWHDDDVTLRWIETTTGRRFLVGIRNAAPWIIGHTGRLSTADL